MFTPSSLLLFRLFFSSSSCDRGEKYRQTLRFSITSSAVPLAQKPSLRSKKRADMDEKSEIHRSLISVLFFFCFLRSYFSPADGYDPLDPNGNITIKWDIKEWNEDSTYNVDVYILNFQLFRHVEAPGWRLSWGWQRDEIIWSMMGAEATEQGDCSKFKKTQPLPHCCKRKPAIVDFLPGAPYNQQSKNCCKGGVLSSMTQDPAKYGAMFQMTVGNAGSIPEVNQTASIMPQNFSLGLPGYTCGPPFLVPPSKSTIDNGRRWTQALMTWNVTCSYSQFMASTAPTCCVSFSAFYNDTIIPCPRCSCGCQGEPGAKCVTSGKTPPVLQLQHNEVLPPAVMCTQHMCPIRVHWHVKVSYREYWRVKMTITNLNFVKNYSQWSLVVQHPNLQSLVQVFSYNYMPLNQYGTMNDTGVFWGIQYYNDMLLQSGENGNVQTEMLFRKEPGIFTFREGWAFPRKISFNGDECVMPPPNEYPRLPNNSFSNAIARPYMSSILFLLIMIFLY